MTTQIVITICSLLLLAYLFDISSKLTKIPSVIMLLVLGWVVRQATGFFNIRIPDLTPLLPVFGTIGLVLIVLEGALEIELNKSKIPVIKKSILLATIPMVLLAFLMAWAFQYFSNVPFKTALINAIPFCVISSAIAIPSVSNLTARYKEFIIYESSLCDIIGVLFFNFFAYNSSINAASFGHFFFELLIVFVVSFMSVIGLSFLLSRIRYHVSFAPIMLIVILLYFVSKLYHLPGLIFILIFGLFLGNLDELKKLKWIEKLRPDKLNVEVKKFKEITTEATFFIRAIFFLMFGFLMEAKEILNLQTLPWALAISAVTILIRYVALRIFRLPSSPLLYIAPKGLITVLLFLAIVPQQAIALVNKSLILQTIILSVVIMMFGLMANKKQDNAIVHNTE
ncbi:MAG: cation:proton antiporter [Taibaiella sp.]|nr:cation:proton antiporter [Taibaiella sp.]